MNHTVGIDLKKRNESRQKQIDSIYKEIIDAYVAGGGTKKEAQIYLFNTYGVHYKGWNNEH